jgi:hypothetical protein
MIIAIRSIALSNITDIKNRFGGKQLQLWKAKGFIGGQPFGAPGRHALGQSGKQFFHQCQIALGLGIAAPRFLDQSCHAAFQRFDIGQHQLGFHGGRITQRVHRPVNMGDLAVIEAAQHMRDCVCFADIGEKLVAKPFALGGTADKPGNIDKFKLGGDDRCRSGQTGQRVKTRVRGQPRGRCLARSCRRDSLQPRPQRFLSAH